MPLVAQHLTQRALERMRVARLDEPAVLAVDEAVAARDRLRPRHDDRLGERHRLEQHRGRAGVAVVEDGKRHGACSFEPVPHLRERKVGLDLDVRRQRAEPARAVARGHDAERTARQLRRNREQELDVAVRIRADRDDVDGCLSIRRRERALVDAERDELDARRLAVATPATAGARPPRTRCRRARPRTRRASARTGAACAPSPASRDARAARSRRRPAAAAPSPPGSGASAGCRPCRPWRRRRRHDSRAGARRAPWRSRRRSRPPARAPTSAPEPVARAQPGGCPARSRLCDVVQPRSASWSRPKRR